MTDYFLSKIVKYSSYKEMSSEGEVEIPPFQGNWNVFLDTIPIFRTICQQETHIPWTRPH